MKKKSKITHDMSTIDNARRSLVKKAFYTTPKLLLLGTMTAASPPEAAAGGSGILGLPPGPPHPTRQRPGPAKDDWLFSE